MRYPIIIHPDERLNKKAEPIEYITDEIVNLLDDMYETMVAHDGIGLAAPQIGKNLRLAVVEVEEGDRERPAVSHQLDSDALSHRSRRTGGTRHGDDGQGGG